MGLTVVVVRVSRRPGRGSAWSGSLVRITSRGAWGESLVSATLLENNSVDLSSALNGTPVKVYYWL